MLATSLLRSDQDPQHGDRCIFVPDPVREAARPDRGCEDAIAAAWRASVLAEVDVSLERLLGPAIGGARHDAIVWFEDVIAALASAPPGEDARWAELGIGVSRLLALSLAPDTLRALAREVRGRAVRAEVPAIALRASLYEIMALDGLGDPARRELADLAVERAEALGDPAVLAQALVVWAQGMRERGPDAALAALERSVGEARAARDRFTEGEGAMVAAQILAHLGRTDAAIAAAETSAALFVAAGAGGHEGRALGQLAVALRRAGRVHDAVAVGRRALARLEASDDALLREHLIDALSCAEDEALAARARSLALAASLRGNERLRPLWIQAEQPRTRAATWGFLKSSWPQLLEVVPTTRQGTMPWLASFFCQASERGEVEAFLGPRIEAVAGGPRNLQGTLEAIELCAARVGAHRGRATAFFEAGAPVRR